jgi:hypothetical protein
MLGICHLLHSSLRVGLRIGYSEAEHPGNSVLSIVTPDSLDSESRANSTGVISGQLQIGCLRGSRRSSCSSEENERSHKSEGSKPNTLGRRRRRGDILRMRITF